METAQSDQGQIGFLGQFCSPTLEQAFRRQHLRDDMRLGLACASVVFAGSLLFICSGYFLYGMSPSFFTLLAARSVNLLACVGVALAIRSSRTATQFDGLILTWGIICNTSNLLIVWAQASGTIGHAMMSFGVPIVAYCIVPVPLAKQFIVTIPFSILSILLAFLICDDLVIPYALSGGCIIANVIGSFASWQRNHRRRQVFLSAVRETELRSSLEQALAEIRTLRGLLPICAWCKRVRNEEEAWQSIESYVQSHSHAEFTHDICETCMSHQFQEGDTHPGLAGTASYSPL
ncbi:hypothetical protein BH10PLA2_BH10PLA2_28120 [soil metagenome]